METFFFSCLIVWICHRGENVCFDVEIIQLKCDNRPSSSLTAHSKYNDRIQRIEQPPLKELINIPKASPVCVDGEMPITCRRTLINANADAYACEHTHTQAQTNKACAHIGVKHMHNTSACVHTTARLEMIQLIQKVSDEPFCISTQWINRNTDKIIYCCPPIIGIMG